MAEWEKLRILGSGTYGTVYLVSVITPQELRGKVVAVKSSSTIYSLNSLLKEQSILESCVDSKEIVQLYFGQYTVERGALTYNLVMEYAPYGCLGDLIRNRPLWESEVRTYTCILLKGLSFIHQKEIVHCDFKPDNILLFPSCNDGVKYQLKIADFGLSKTKEETINADFWKTCKFRGTPFYMSPESIKGHIETPLDIWSLGCIVIEMITGLRAWRNVETIEEIMCKLFLQEAPKIPNGVSVHCHDFLSKCFTRDPSQRWTARMLLNHPFVCSPLDVHRGYQNINPMMGSSFFSYDIFDYVSQKI